MRHGIPLGTLVVLIVCWSFTRWREHTPPRQQIEPAPAADVTPITFPERRGTCSGRVVDDQQQGIASALVWLQAADELSFTETKPDGSFAFEALSSGIRIVGVLAHGWKPQRFSIEDDGKPALLKLDERNAPSPTLPELRRSRLSGRVVAAGRGLAGAQVCLNPRDPPETFGAPIPVRTECDAEGRFSFDALIEGDYRVLVLPAWAKDGSWPDALQPLASSGITELVHATASSANEIELASRCGSLAGIVTTTSGAPVEAALVVVTPAGQPNRLWPTASSGGDGRFTCNDLPPGRYRVTLSAGAATRELDVDVRAEERADLATIVLDIALDATKGR